MPGRGRPAGSSIDPVLLTVSVTPELAEWLRVRAVQHSNSLQKQIREELEEHRRYCIRDPKKRSA